MSPIHIFHPPSLPPSSLCRPWNRFETCLVYISGIPSNRPPSSSRQRSKRSGLVTVRVPLLSGFEWIPRAENGEFTKRSVVSRGTVLSGFGGKHKKGILSCSWYFINLIFLTSDVYTYFDQLSGAGCTQKLVEILFWTFSTFFVCFKSFSVILCLKRDSPIRPKPEDRIMVPLQRVDQSFAVNQL